jgi:hypothetical protein
MKEIRFLFFAVILFFLTLQIGCTSVGMMTDTSHVQTIQKGATTRTDVEAKLGLPNMVSVMGDGSKIFIYNYREYRTRSGTLIPFFGFVDFAFNTKDQTLQIMLDRKDIVVDYVYTDTPGAVRIR